MKDKQQQAVLFGIEQYCLLTKENLILARRNRQKKSPVAAFCSALGTVLLTVLILACIPLTLPKAFGFQIYTVISGSMEPAIPTGSLVYVRYEEPDTIVKDDVIAFYSNNADGSIITHRVVSNSPAMGQFITKGDANEEKDMNPIPYNNYIGKVKLSVPVVGGIAQAATGTSGKIAAASMIGLAVILEIVAAMLDRRDDEDE